MEAYKAWTALPIVVATWNPKTDASQRVLIAGGLPHRATKDEAAMAELFTPRVWKTASATSPHGSRGSHKDSPIRAMNDIYMFPEDNLMEMREKIHLATGIPIYRQHVFTIGASGKLSGLYSIFTDSPAKVDIREIQSEPSAADNVLGLPIDRELYAARDYLHITAGETFSLLSQWMPSGGTIWVVDLNVFLAPIATQLAAYVGDKYMIDLIYWGFIAKYWPIMTIEVFVLYMTGEHNLRSAFPSISKSISEARRKHDTEREIVLQRYALAHKARTMSKNVSITQFTATVTSISVHVNIRNIFEMSRVTPDMPSIIAYVDTTNGKKVRVVRSLYDAPPAEAPNSPAFLTGIVFAIQTKRNRRQEVSGDGKKHGGAISPLTGNYMWLAIHPNGKYYVRSTWPEDAAIDFSDIYVALDEYVTPVINSINSMGRLVFNTGVSLEPVSRETVSFQGLNVSVSWKQPMSIESFRILRNAWDAYTIADIAVVRPTTLYDRVELTFRKGMYANDPAKIGYVVSMSGIDLTNMYSYLSSPFIAKKWAQNYGGRTCSVSMRESDVRIDVIDIREDEFRGSFLDYMFTHLWEVTHSDEFVNVSKSASTSGRLVRRLRDTDPELFNMSKYGVTRKYSQICQGPRQPSIIDDPSTLSERKAKSVVKYWNFTRSEPAYYACPNPKFPHLSFITNMHPAGYCLPCCNKRNRDDAATAACLKDHKWSSADTYSEHIMAYGKSIPSGRYSQMHPSAMSLFTGMNVVLASCDQPDENPVPEWRIICAAAAALQLPLDKVIGVVQRVIGDMYETFGDAVAGRDKQSLINELAAGPRAAGVDWIEIISTGINVAYSRAIVVFDDAYDAIRIRVPQSTIDNDADGIIIINVTQTRAYPLYRPDESSAGDGFIFNTDMSQVAAILAGARKSNTRYMDIAAAKRIPGWKIAKKYVNMQNLCYAVELVSESTKKSVYLPITYSAHGADGLLIDTIGFDPNTTSIDVGDLLSVLATFGANISITSVARWARDAAGGGMQEAIVVHADDATLYCYYTTGAAGDKLPVVELPYDPIAVTNAILSRKFVDPDEDEIVAKEQYRMSIYNALVMHIGEKLREERNNDMRARVIAAARNPEDLMELDVIIDGKPYGKLSATDMGIIRATLQFTGIKGLVKRLNAPFDFDMITMMRIQAAATRKEAISIIRAITDKITVSKKDRPARLFPNIYTVCAYDPDQPFCEGDRLVVDSIEELLPILADDLRNPLRAATIFGEAWTKNIIDPMQFTRYGNDRFHD